jgi:hypothetical protein
MLALLTPLVLAAVSPALDRLVSPSLSGFVVDYEAGNAEQAIREEVPKGETVQQWTRMVTTQWFAGVSTRLTAAQFLQNVAGGLEQSCPKATTTKPVLGTRSGRPSAQFRANCPYLASTGKPETFYMLAIAGPSDLHVKQVAFRRVPSAADAKWAETFLAGVTLR